MDTPIRPTYVGRQQQGTRRTIGVGVGGTNTIVGDAAHVSVRVGNPRVHLYGMKHSHPVLASRMALELTGIQFEPHDLFPGLHGLIVRAHGFPAWSVPALAIDGCKVQGSLVIARELDRLAPEAGLFPRNPERRRAVVQAERFGHDELQPIARRVFRWAGAHDNAIRAWMARYVVGAPAPTLAGYAFKPVMMFFARVVSKADAVQVREDLRRLPALLDRADALIEDGTIGGRGPNAADLQVLTSIRLLMAHEDLRPAIAPRPCGTAALRLIPDYPRSGPDALPPVPAALPLEWLPHASGNPNRRINQTNSRRKS
jgi:glutathione S-transferase